MKPVEFLGDSLDALRSFPRTARREAGFQLDRVQRGLDPDDWKPMKSVGSGEVWMKVVAEPFQIGIEDLAEISLNQVKNSDPMAKVTRNGSRQVNGLNLVFREIEATFFQQPFTFYNHYYSDTSGCIQILGWTSRSLLEEHRSTIEEFLEGFEVSPVTPILSPEINASPSPDFR